MADHDDGTAKGSKIALEPLDRLDVEMIGRLVQEEDFGIANECSRKGDPPGFTAGNRFRPEIRVDVETRKRRQSEVAACVRILITGQAR